MADFTALRGIVCPVVSPCTSNEGVDYDSLQENLARLLRAPITGMGQGAFQEKYKVYPHNMFLEMLCETGIIGTVPLVLLLALTLFGILRTARRSRGAAEILLLLGAYFVRENISNSIWQSVPLFAALGFGLALAAFRPQTSTAETGGDPT